MNPQSTSATPVSRAVPVLAVILSLPAVVVPFVSFTWNTSPLDTVVELFRSGSDWIFVLLGAPFFLGIPIVAAQIARITSRNMSRWCRNAGFALASFSAALSLAFEGMMVLDILEDVGVDDLSGYVALLLVPAILAIAGIWLWRTRRVADATSQATVALVAAFLANASLCLFTFSDDPDLGWWLALAASVGMAIGAAQIVIAARRSSE